MAKLEVEFSIVCGACDNDFEELAEIDIHYSRAPIVKIPPCPYCMLDAREREINNLNKARDSDV